MTVEERARELWQALAWLTDDEILTDSQRGRGIASIEKHFRDQIEDCAKLMDKQAAGFQVLIDHAPTPIRAEDLKRVKHSIEVVAKQIRALAKPAEERKESER